VTFLDVGQGSAILAQSGSQRLLVNAGPDGNDTVQALDRVLPPWQRSLNLVVLTDWATGHAGGLDSVLNRYRVGAVMNGDVADNSVDWQTKSLAGNAVKLPQAPVATFDLGEWQMIVDSRPSGGSPGRSGNGNSEPTVIAKRGSRAVVLAGDKAASVPAAVRSLTPGQAGDASTQTRVSILETVRPAPAIPEGGGNSLVYRTAENGDIAVDLRPSDIQVRVARGFRYGIGGIR
jgi:beta-lactamase superfamily II metal-dependent hydrolase